MIEILSPDFTHVDDRGTLVQLVRQGYKQVNVVTSQAGTFRGGHYHKENYEAFYVVEGAFQLVCEKDGQREEHTFSKGTFFRIAPFTVHSFTYLQDTILIGLYDVGVEKPDGTKDIFPA